MGSKWQYMQKLYLIHSRHCAWFLIIVSYKERPMLSTVLFIDDAPVGYTIHLKGHKLVFTPSPFSSRFGDSPPFTLSKVDGLWLVDGEVDSRIRQQVYGDLERFRAAGLLE